MIDIFVMPVTSLSFYSVTSCPAFICRFVHQKGNAVIFRCNDNFVIWVKFPYIFDPSSDLTDCFYLFQRKHRIWQLFHPVTFFVFFNDRLCQDFAIRIFLFQLINQKIILLIAHHRSTFSVFLVGFYDFAFQFFLFLCHDFICLRMKGMLWYFL